jgi:hypothetical protein
MGVEGPVRPVTGSERRRAGSILRAFYADRDELIVQGVSGTAATAAAAAPSASPMPTSRGTVTVVEELPPLPEEVVVHRRLKSFFIDLDALVATLRVDRLTGYLRAQSKDFEGVLLFNRGERGLSCYRGEGIVSGPGAGELVRRRAAEDDVLLDVVRVRSVTAEMLPTLFVGRWEPVGVTRFVIVDQLLTHLAEQGGDATVVVTGVRDCGVVVVRGGRIDSAWTRLHPRPSANPDAVLLVAREPSARVDLVGGPPV